MIKNYFKIAWRNLVHNKTLTAINIAGLSIGITVCLILFVIIQFQTSFDNFHQEKSRIYRILTQNHTNDGSATFEKDVPFPLPAGIKTTFPQVKQVAPVLASQNDLLLITKPDGTVVKTFKEQQGVFFTDPSFFKIFNFPLLSGSYTSLNDPGNVLVTKEIAEKYFGDWRLAIGKNIKLQSGGSIFEHGTELLKVSGILATIPANTDFQLKLVVAFGTGFTGDNRVVSANWNETGANFGCYILLPPNFTASNFNRQLNTYSRKVRSAGNKDSNIIQPLDAVHYDTQAGNYSGKTISHQLINVLWLIAAFILLIACINFINLSTAQAINRAKEIGVRKVLGSSKSQLQIQFISETFLIVGGAVIFATVAVLFALPYINRLLELSLSYKLLNSYQIFLFVFIIVIIVTALAGFYPSIVLSRFNPVNALKSKIATGTANGILIRRGLVIFQFFIAQVLIIGTLVIIKQINYFMEQPLGFQKDAIVNIPFRVDSVRLSKLDYLKKQLLSIPGVQAVSFSSNTPIEDGNDIMSPVRFDHGLKGTDFSAITKFADNEYVNTYKLPIIAGRNLQPATMVKEFLINETLVKNLGLKSPEDALNKDISTWNDAMHGPIVGVLKNFNDRSFRDALTPLLITTDFVMYNQAAVKISATNVSSTLQSVKKIFVQTFPDLIYEYRFLDDKIDGFYRQENQLATLYKIFAVIAIFLSCLGLYGLASFMAVQRVKEVGIRKVLGASAGNITYLFTREFVALVAISFFIATPVAWYYLHQWLQNYVYRINVNIWLMLAGGVISISIAVITVSFQAIKASLANPVKSLRSE